MMKFTIFSLSILLVSILEGYASTSTRGSKQLYLIQDPSAAGFKSGFQRRAEWAPYSMYPTIISNSDDDSTSRKFFGLANLLRPNNVCPTCPTCPTCATCAVCPAACPGTTNPANPILISVPGITGCTTGGIDATTGIGACSAVTAAPSGSFVVSFPTGATTTGPNPTAFIGIVPTCPNTKITLTCGNLLAGYVVTTQSRTVGTGALATSTLTQSGFMQVMVTQIASSTAALASSVACTWLASP